MSASPGLLRAAIVRTLHIIVGRVGSHGLLLSLVQEVLGVRTHAPLQAPLLEDMKAGDERAEQEQ